MRKAKGIAAALLLAACSCFAADTTVTIQVVNPANKPVDNAEVIMDFLGSREMQKLGRKQRVHWEMRTDQDGLAHFPPVPQGTLRVQVVAKSYQTFGDKFEITEDQKTIDVKLKDPQQQYSAHPPLKPKDPNQ